MAAAKATGQRLLLGTAKSRAFRCLWMLEELGLPYRHVPSAAPQSELVRKHNPLGKIPVLIDDDGLVLFESGAILSHLGDKHRTPNQQQQQQQQQQFLVPPPGTHRRAKYEQTMSVLLTELDAQGLWIHRKHDEDAMGRFFGIIPDAVEHARKYFHKTNRFLMKQLETSGGPYLLGNDFAAVDIVYVQCLDWSVLNGWDQKWKQNPTVVGYRNTCRSRPAYRRVLAAMAKEPQTEPTSTTTTRSKL
eukprot:jgi/Psemu1/200350/e_gw1.256.48.1